MVGGEEDGNKRERNEGREKEIGIRRGGGEVGREKEMGIRGEEER